MAQQNKYRDIDKNVYDIPYNLMNLIFIENTNKFNDNTPIVLNAQKPQAFVYVSLNSNYSPFNIKIQNDLPYDILCMALFYNKDSKLVGLLSNKTVESAETSIVVNNYEYTSSVNVYIITGISYTN